MASTWDMNYNQLQTPPLCYKSDDDAAEGLTWSSVAEEFVGKLQKEKIVLLLVSVDSISVTKRFVIMHL